MSHQWTDLHQIWLVNAVSVKDVPFGGLDDDQSRLRVLTPKNRNFGGVNRHCDVRLSHLNKVYLLTYLIQAKSTKKFKSSHLQNYASD